MTFKLWHKLVLTMVCITGIVLILAIYLSHQSVKTGFLAYLNGIESRRTDSFSEILVNEYETHQSWDFIRDNRPLWNRYFTQSKAANIRKESNAPSLPRLKELGQTAKIGDKQAIDELPLSRHLPPRPKYHPKGENRPPPPFMRKRNKPFPRSKPPRSTALLDVNKAVVVGRGIATDEATFRPLKLNGKIVGYLRSEPFNKITDELDQQFVQYQNQAFIKIALLALVVILIGTGLFAAYLRSRINRIGDQAGTLTAGDYSPQTPEKSQDELGQLSKKLNMLAATLEDNRSSRRRWISDISHELRTPVTVLKGEIEAIQDKVRELTPSSIDSLHQEVLRLSRLINDLNELSLSDLGALSYHKEPIDIVELIEDIISQHQHQFDEKNIDIEFTTSNKSILIDGDGQRLEQLFANLASNSQHYTTTKGSLKVNLKNQLDTVVIEWSDSEPGVSDEDLERLFERLYRVEASRNRNAGGSGLGLSISQNIVSSHDGSIQAEHSPLGGITFTIIFPLLKT